MSDDHSQRPELRLVGTWTMIGERPIRERELRVAPVEVSGREISLSLTPEGWRGVLIPLRDGEVVRIPPDFRHTSKSALRAEVAQYFTDCNAENALHIWCRDAACRDAFTSFSVFLLDRADSDTDLATLLVESYAEFQRLLGSSEAVDLARVIGLVGELLVLLDGLRTDKRFARYWAGPRGERHDFRRGVNALEVKCSLRSGIKAHRVRVSDWDQLEIPEGGSLHLHSVRLERVEGGDWSVPRLLAGVRSELNGEDLAEFDALISGIDDALTGCPTEFTIKERHTYRVADGFPRLVPGMLPGGTLLGVSGVSYTLDLDQAEPFRAAWPEVVQLLARDDSDA